MDPNQEEIRIQKAVRDYYGSLALSSSKEAPIECGCSSAGSACCTTEQEKLLNFGSIAYADEALDELPADVTHFSLGCGDPITLAKLQPGQTVLDLGSGGGMDCFLAATRVGVNGTVIGVDMTDEMITKARANQAKLGVDNVEFRQGEIENLPIDDHSVDVIISNCVINLSTDKLKVFQEAYRVLKPGGKFAVSDIVTTGNLPKHIIKDLSAWACCIGGALNIEDINHLLTKAGFDDIIIQPYYWDGDIFEAYTQQEHCEDNLLCESSELQHKQRISELQSAIFSAKITAFKPIHEI
jgi:SAM-dependent methyltransferase